MTLHNETEAIKQAVEAGYKPDFKTINYSYAQLDPADKKSNYRFINELEVMTAAFWQALGKARGWDADVEKTGTYLDMLSTENWKHHALRYFEVKLSGGDLNQFWETLP